MTNFRGKRVLDLSLLLPTLPVFGLVMGVLALLLLVAQGRPIFFSQPRLGRGRRVFQILKFRSMSCEPEPHLRRPTPIGGWLRQRGLDELPQLWNVVLGHMSLVGPRPLTANDANRLEALHPQFADRFALPPGLTGLAQVCGARGVSLTSAVDGHYARKWSVGLDAAILVRTMWINLVGKRRGVRSLPANLAQS